VKNKIPVDGLSDAERTMLIDGLRALRKERGKAWIDACDAAEAVGQRHPLLRPFGIDDIVRLARRLGGTAPHWSEE
jgi:hypothetical protein